LRNRVGAFGTSVPAIALAVGVGLAIARSWLCDDAFISFRYARNLVEGLGLVYNAGERVEGYTNFLWTLWCAAGLRLGISAETWARIWGIVLYAGSLLLLWSHHRYCRRRNPENAFPFPIAMILGAALTDWAIYATSGLETSAVTFLSLLAYVRVVQGPATGVRRSAEVGAICALAVLTRPDAVLLLPPLGLYVFLRRRPRAASLAALAAGFAALVVPVLLWKLSYYGQFLPNTYYAKSGGSSWWSQGFHYVGLFFRQYGVLLGGFLLLPLSVFAHRRNRSGTAPTSLLPESLLAAGIALLHIANVARVGGDFMYARLLIPAVPFGLILLEHGLIRLPTSPRPLRPLVAAAVLIALLAPPSPVTDAKRSHGIVNEWMYYRSEAIQRAYVRNAPVLRHYFAGLPVRVAFFGTEARLMYQARIPVAIECETGLTDPEIARRPLTRRGRVGHEKPASLHYLIASRRAHFAFLSTTPSKLHMEDSIPLMKIGFDGVTGWILRWDPEIMRALRERGAVFEDFPGDLDRFLAGIDSLSEDQVAEAYRMLKLFYFDSTDDAPRETPFLARLRAPARVGGTVP
jgi:hypothetical protein